MYQDVPGKDPTTVHGGRENKQDEQRFVFRVGGNGVLTSSPGRVTWLPADETPASDNVLGWGAVSVGWRNDGVGRTAYRRGLSIPLFFMETDDFSEGQSPIFIVIDGLEERLDVFLTG